MTLTGDGGAVTEVSVVMLPERDGPGQERLKPATCLQLRLLTMAAVGERLPSRWNQTAMEKLFTSFCANHVRKKDTCARKITSTKTSHLI